MLKTELDKRYQYNEWIFCKEEHDNSTSVNNSMGMNASEAVSNGVNFRKPKTPIVNNFKFDNFLNESKLWTNKSQIDQELASNPNCSKMNIYCPTPVNLKICT